MIKRALKQKTQQKIDINSINFSPEPISLDEFVFGFKKFLNEFYEGSFITQNTVTAFRRIWICPQGFAYFTKTIIERAFGEQLLKIWVTTEAQQVKIHLSFNTEILTDEDKAALSCISQRSGFSYEITDSGVFVYTKAYICQSIPISQKKFNQIYIAFKRIFGK